eukprot:1491098-Prymnesium_polylepis.2
MALTPKYGKDNFLLEYRNMYKITQIIQYIPDAVTLCGAGARTTVPSHDKTHRTTRNGNLCGCSDLGSCLRARPGMT